MQRNPEIPVEIDLWHVVVFKICLEIEIIPIRDNFFGEDLAYSQNGTYEATYELVSSTYETVGGLVGVKLKALKLKGFVWYL